MEFPATVEDNRFDVLVIRIPNDVTTGQATCKCIEREADGFKFSPCRALDTFRGRPILMENQFGIGLSKRTTARVSSIGETKSDRKRPTSPVNFVTEGLNVILPKRDFRNRTFRQQNFAIPGNGCVEIWS